MERPNLYNSVVADKYRIRGLIGRGSFGYVYEATNLLSGKEVAVKVEPAGAYRHSPLRYEANVLKAVRNMFGFPKLFHFGTEKEFNIMIMEALGPSLEDLFDYCKRRFTLKTVLMLAEEMLPLIEDLHSRFYIHRDIKPENFLMGVGRHSSRVYLIDFGLAKRYLNQHTSEHIPYREDKPFTGSARYASVNAHRGIEQSRRDDLESLGYVMIYFLRGILPWQGLPGVTKKQKFDRVTERKMLTTIEELCKGLPKEMHMYFKYCRDLGFDEKPNYWHLRQLLQFMFHKYMYQAREFDWEIRNKAERRRGGG